MDLNQGSAEKKDEASQNANAQPQAPAGQPEVKQEEPKQEKPRFQFTNPKLQQIAEGKTKFYMPKLKMPNLREKFSEYGRVWKVTKKPDSEEFKAIVKASGLGIIVIGMVGFVIAIIVQIIQMI